MSYYLLILALQIFCIVHLIRNRGNPIWAIALIFLPLLSGIAYLLVEVLPGMQGNRRVQGARMRAITVLDPERELRAARNALEMADTAANRVRLADALAALGRHGEAVPVYREALSRMAGIVDAPTEVRLAGSLFETGSTLEALAILDGLATPTAQSDRDKQGLLRARILEKLGRSREALDIYADISTRLPGEEARCRYAALLIETGDTALARDVLAEVERRMRLLTRQQRAADADMYRWATEMLRKLRA